MRNNKKGEGGEGGGGEEKGIWKRINDKNTKTTMLAGDASAAHVRVREREMDSFASETAQVLERSLGRSAEYVQIS